MRDSQYDRDLWAAAERWMGDAEDAPPPEPVEDEGQGDDEDGDDGVGADAESSEGAKPGKQPVGGGRK
jgi:hypothetical protein